MIDRWHLWPGQGNAMSGLSRAEVNLSQEVSQPSPATSMLRFAVCAVVVFAAAGYASSFTPGPWYRTLQSPVGTPPNWVFPPVWSVLYALLAISFWWFWEQADAKPPTSRQVFRLGAAVFVVQLIANALWSQFFFGWHWIGLALIHIGFLWLSILAMMLIFRRNSPLAANLLLPYLAWVGYATYLNAGFLYLNRE